MSEVRSAPGQRTKSKRKADIPFDSYLALKIKEMWWSLRQEPWSFWFLCAYLFFEYTRLQSMFPIIGIIPWAQLSLLGCFVFILTGREKKWVNSPATWPLVLLFLHVILSIVFSFDRSASIAKFSVMLNWMLLFYCMLTVVTTQKRLFIVILLIVLATFKMANHATLSFASRGFSFSRCGIAGPSGWFGDSADLALQVLIYICLAVAILLLSKDKAGKWVKLLYIYMIVAGFFTIIAAGNRGSIVALVPMVIYMLMFLKHRFRNLFVLFLLGAVLYIGSPAEFKQRFETAGTDRTSQTRLEQWGRGVRAANQHPIVGVGYESWASYMRANYNDGLVAHSIYFTVLGELGYVGLFWYLILMLTVFILNIKTRRIAKSCGDRFSEVFSVALNVGLMAFSAAGLFISVNYYPFLFVQLSLTAVLYEFAKSEKEKDRLKLKEVAV
jgi:putative inorganic carbon (HCO3(-)) transporter